MLQEKRLEQIKYVVENAAHIKLNQEKLDKWADSIKGSNFDEHPWKKYNKDFNEKEIILLAFFIESMNFCFWKEPIFKYKDKKKSTAMMDLFIDAALKSKQLLNTNYLINLKYEDLIKIFMIEEGNLKKRYNSLMYSVRKINENKNFFDDLFNIKSTEDLYNFIVDFGNFKDVSIYKGKEIFFYKRATLLVHDLFDLSETIHDNIKNIDTVLGCADYVIPRGLRLEGILEYDNELADKIDNFEEIPQDSEYEVEIRAFTLYVIEYVKNKNDKDVNSAVWDNLIWNYFRGKGGIAHRTDTIFY